MAEPKRATWHAECALKTHTDVTAGHDNEKSTQVRDLLSDLMHYCDANAIDFNYELSMATDTYGDEKAGII